MLAFGGKCWCSGFGVFVFVFCLGFVVLFVGFFFVCVFVLLIAPDTSPCGNPEGL